MASSSSSACNSQYYPQWKYDVFLSFRGEDTRKTFTGHLYEGFKNRGIFTFQDDKRLEHGDTIPEELLKAIKESQVALVVFSKNYATSRWCLDELVKIMECKDKNGQTVIPVFYDVDPSHVRNQRESFAEAFAEHEFKYKDDVEGMQKVQGWRTALTEATNLKGCDICDRIESECIQDLVDQISSKLCKTSLSYLQDIVGINTHLEKVKSQLEMEINDVRIVGIWGMGGVGKTTIARANFDTLSSQFDGACFLADIKENKHGIHSLINILLSELLRKKENYVNNKEDGKHLMARRLRFMKVLVVLDDIDHEDHLNYLAGDLGWFGNGSRIIATTRDKHLIGKNDAVYEVTSLLEHDAIQLFNKYAFKGEARDECFEELTLEVVSHAKGLPLALKVWGSFLYKRDITEWRSVVHRIKNNSSSEIVEKLKISYDGLEREEQDIFLDIACFFRGIRKDEIMPILDSCDSGADIGLGVLIDKSLVFISEYDTIQMHDLIQEMGTYIVKTQKDPGERSRIWDTEDCKEVIIDNTGTRAVEAVMFTYSEKLCFSKEAMKNMKRLRILYICDDRLTYFSSPPSSIDSEDIPYGSNCHDGSIEYLSNNLCWFVWNHYPWVSLPENFKPQRLVHLDLRWSLLHDLWTKRKHLPSLRRLDLSHSKSLMQTPDFTEMQKLEYLVLEECTSLEEVHHSLRCSKKLIQLNLYGCESLKRFPYVNVKALESLDIRLCSSLEKFPKILGIMKPELEISVGGSGISELPSSIFQHHACLTELDLSDMENLVALPNNICKLKGLVKLDLSYCSKLESLPEEIGDLENLEALNARNTLISRPPSSIVHLNKLKFLSFAELGLEDGVYFVFPQVNEGLHSLEILNLSYCNFIYGRLPEDIGCLSSLKELNLRGNNFEHLPRSIPQLGALRSLDLSHCKRLTQLPELPQQLDTIHADWSSDSICNSLFQNISSLKHDISASDSLSLRVFTSWGKNIPIWFHHRGTGTSVSVNLPENWYVRDNFLGFAVCYSGKLIDTTAHLIPLCDDGMSWMIQKLALSNHSECDAELSYHSECDTELSYHSECDTELSDHPEFDTELSDHPEFDTEISDHSKCDTKLSDHSEFDREFIINFFLVPFAGLWDTSKANGKTPNDYVRIMLSFSEELKEFGLRMLYKDEPEPDVSCNDEPTEHHDEASSSSCNEEPTEHCIGIRWSTSCCRIL